MKSRVPVDEHATTIVVSEAIFDLIFEISSLNYPDFVYAYCHFDGI